MQNRIAAYIARAYLFLPSDTRIRLVAGRKNAFWQKEQNTKEKK
jgi:hypothetical protein